MKLTNIAKSSLLLMSPPVRGRGLKRRMVCGQVK